MKTIMIERPAGWVRAAPLAVWAGLAGATTWVLAFNPTDRVADPTGPCTWHMVFGVDGPTCGGTRMYFYLIHGNLIEAARMHLAALLGLGFGAYLLVAWTASWLLGGKLAVWRPGQWVIAGYVAFFVIYSVVLRNLPWPTFTWFYVPNLT